MTQGVAVVQELRVLPIASSTHAGLFLYFNILLGDCCKIVLRNLCFISVRELSF
jgi:hypothetical protein